MKSWDEIFAEGRFSRDVFKDIEIKIRELTKHLEPEPKKPREFYLAYWNTKDEWEVYLPNGPIPHHAIKVREVVE